MGDWILRAEGVNFDDTVFNTNDLSTVRGSSLALEAFVHALDRVWLKKQTKKYTRCYYGGSQVAFKIEGIDEPEAMRLAAAARVFLSEAKTYPTSWPDYFDHDNHVPTCPPDNVIDSLLLKLPSEHMRFVVEIAEVKGDLRDAVNRAMWQSRRRQMLAPNLPNSPGADAGTSKIGDRAALICPIDPAQTIDPSTINRAGFYDNTSKRSADLHSYGRDARRMLYPVQLGNAQVVKLVKNGLFDTRDFAQSFHQIVDNSPDGISESARGKLAYLHFDGNGFSKIRAENDLGKFSKAVENINAHVLNGLLSAFLPGGHDKAIKARMFSKGKIYVREFGTREDRELLRFETLLYGGEDFVVVLPAWLAWEFAWKILGWYADGVKDHAGSLAGPKMTHRCGMVICDQKMPVRRARDLAYSLCEDAKRAYAGTNAQAALAFHIIESHDIPEETGDTETNISLHRSNLYSVIAGSKVKLSADTTAKAFRVLGASRMEYQMALVKLKAVMARSRLYRLIDDLDHCKGDGLDGFLFEKLTEYTTKGRTGASADELIKLLEEGRCPEVPWNLHLKILADLWDYVDPFDDEPAGDAS